MTAASGDPGEKPDYEGHPPSAPGIPPADPAYGGWQPPEPPAADYPPAYAPPPGPAPGYAPPPGPPPGYGPTPAAPFSGYPPPYDAPYGYYPGYPPAAAAGTNMLAIASLVSSVFGVLCFVGSLAGIVTGLIAIGQVKRTGQKGYGLAVAGTVVGVAGLLLYLVMVAVALRG